MKSYRRNFVKKALRESTKKGQETRDGIIWEIYDDTGFGAYCLVKIQNSEKPVTAHYPRTQVNRPNWLQVGSAVRLVHRGGIRGYIEVIGPGRAIPQPMTGNALPSGGTTGNGIISGMVVSATVPVSNSVSVSPGTYRIAGIIHHFNGTSPSAITMNDPPLMYMGNAPIITMGVFSANMFPPAPTQYLFRYDIIVIGEDGVLEVLSGDEVTANPVIPGVPAGKILLNFVLRVYNDEGVLNGRLGMVWTPPKQTIVETTYPKLLDWDENNNSPEATIGMKIMDQYGKEFPASSTGWTVTMRKLYGTGLVWSDITGYAEETVTDSLFSSYQTSFKYQRDQLVPELNPMFMITVEIMPPLYAFIFDMELGSPPIGG